VRDQLRALAKLSEIDASARELDQELKEIPERVNEMRADVERLEALLDKERRDLEEAEQLGRSHVEQVATATELLARAKAKGAKARNAREAEAADREMEGVRRTIKEREEEHGRLSEAMGRVRQSLEDHGQELEALRKMFGEEETKANARIAEVEGERSKVLHGRDELTAQINGPLLKRYERIRGARGVAMVEVVNGTCMGCQMSIPPQQYNDLQRGSEMAQCAHCHRIVYYRAAIED